MQIEVKRTIKEVLLAAVTAAVFYLFAAALFAVFFRACAPAQGVVTAVNWTLKAVGAFVFCMIFIHGGRALFKGMAAGALSAVLALLLFAAIGGGFRVTAWFLLELLLSAVMGGIGALIGVKTRKEA